MRKQNNKERITTTLLIAFVCMCVCVGIGYELYYLTERGEFPHDYPAFANNSDSSIKYEIDPETILSSLDQGETEVFNPVFVTPEAYAPLEAGSFSWAQSDYLKIANALAQIESMENLNDWHVLGMTFEKECSDNPKGFDSGSIIYFKFDNDNGVSDYLHYQTQTIAIYPLFRSVDVGRNGFPRPLFGWRSVNLNNLNVTADEALQIAEENGGEKTRIKANNNCDITVYNSPINKNNDWEVIYWGLFEIHIDPYSGRYEIVDMDG